MKIYHYLFYRLNLYYNKGIEDKDMYESYISISGYTCLYIASLMFFLDGIFNFGIYENMRLYDKNFIKFIVTPIFFSPVYIFVYFYYKKKKEIIFKDFDEFKKESKKSKKRNGWFVGIYIGALPFILVLSMFSREFW